VRDRAAADIVRERYFKQEYLVLLFWLAAITARPDVIRFTDMTPSFVCG
jgi:hypothetical protein